MNTSRSERGGILAGLLITGAVLVCVAMLVGLNIARSVRVEKTPTADGEHVSISTPAGEFSIRAHKHGGMELVDIPHYPGARESKHGGGAEFEWTSGDGREAKDFSVAGAEMITNDSASKVLDYYHERLPAWIVSHDHSGQVTLKEPNSTDDSGRFIAIREKFDGTHIGVASVGAPAAN
jgi:hypothetical protein